MKIFQVYEDSVDDRALQQAVAALRDGGVVIYPTDTLYALGCDALNARAVERLCRIKGLDTQRQTLSMVCCGLSQAAEYVQIDNNAFRLLKDNLPGPFTFLLPAQSRLPKVMRGRRVVGVRVPDNKICQRLVEAFGSPLMSTSVELSDPEDVGNPDAIALQYASVAEVMLDGGDGGEEGSTVVDCIDSSAPEIVRYGAGHLEE